MASTDYFSICFHFVDLPESEIASSCPAAHGMDVFVDRNKFDKLRPHERKQILIHEATHAIWYKFEKEAKHGEQK